ncbi:hypothetical protein KFE25_000909 [Diacronema lutheri]|uniref:Uncharacterized protein n=1 Tax=Diacronema lutheri TaxID=2081491 RepID=A0A8J5XA23_DIALT|nr:hypothetical protein KFE25_000909 [Diacronema lutheri]
MGRIHKDFALNLKFNSKSQFRKQRVLAPCQGEMMALFTCWSLHNYDESACRAAYLALQSCSRTAAALPRTHKATTNYHLAQLARQAGK